MQFQADVLDIPVVRPAVIETTALGAAMLAGLATGVWGDMNELAAIWNADVRLTPRMSLDERARIVRDWHRAVERSQRWVEA